MSKERKPELGPGETQGAQVRPAKTVAGGMPAILSSLQHSLGEMGLTRSLRELGHVNQMGGFDCPGCAWPDPDDRRAMTEFCENGAKAVAEEATRRQIGADFFAQHSVATLATWSDYEIGKAGRLSHPMVLREGATHYTPIAWDEAFALIAEELNALPSPDQAIFYTSGRTSNEAAFLYQLFVRLYGTNNLPDCSNMCHESSGVAMTETLGVGKGSVSLADFAHADCILIIGQNPGTNHPRMLSTLQEAAARGAKIISINPLFEAGLRRFKHPQQFQHWLGRGTALASLHLPVRVNGDMAVFKGLMKIMLEAEATQPGSVVNHDFIGKHTEGFAAFAQHLRDTPWDDIIEQGGLRRESLEEAAAIVMASRNMICCWAMGLTQQTHGVACIKEVVNLLLLGGHFGRPGAGACPVRGHSNVQGDRTMGIWERPHAAFLDALQKEFAFSPPRHHGWDVVEAIKAMARGEGKVFFAMGGNFLSAAPDTLFTAEALRQTRLSVHVATKLNRSHLVHGRRALILPCLGRTEIDRQRRGVQLVSVEDSMGVVRSSRGNLEPGSPWLKSEVAIVCALAKATFRAQAAKRDLVAWDRLADDYDGIRAHIERVIPGFERFNERVRLPAGFPLPHAVRDELQFRTPSQKALFTTTPLPRISLPEGALMLMTIRSHDQFNTTIYGLDDRYRGIGKGRRVIFMNADDIAARGLVPGGWVDITSHFGEERRCAEAFMVVAYDIPPRCAAAYFPETNVLVPIGSVVGGSQTPTYKSIVVTVAPTSVGTT